MAFLLAGLDVGTTAVKAIVLDEDGRRVGGGRAPTPWRGTELDAQELLTAARAALATALAPDQRVGALGVASMGETGVLVDAHGRPVAPVIAWHDRRDEAEMQRLAQDLGAEAFAARTGLPLRPQWSLTKHRWLVDHVPAARTAVRRLGIAEWLVRALGGEEASEQSLASRTGWLGLAERAWWPEAVAWSGAKDSLLPVLVTAGTPLGVVRELPELEGAVLTVAGHDHQSAAVGVGAAGPGDELHSCGSAGALIRTVPAGLGADAVGAIVSAGMTVGWHAVADRWCVLRGTRSGLLLERVLGLLGLGVGELAQLDARAEQAAPDAVVVVRRDAGHIDVQGIGDGVGPAEVWRAAIETATADARLLHEAMAGILGPAGRIVVTGGWAKSAAFVEARRRAFGALTLRAADEAGARGAALFGGVAAGVYGDVSEVGDTTAPTSST